MQRKRAIAIAIAKQQERNRALMLAGGLLLWMMGSRLQAELSGVLREGLSFPRELAFEPSLLLEHGAHLTGRALWALLPFAAVLLVVVIAAPLLVGGWLFSVKSFSPRFDRLDPGMVIFADVGKCLAEERFQFRDGHDRSHISNPSG